MFPVVSGEILQVRFLLGKLCQFRQNSFYSCTTFLAFKVRFLLGGWYFLSLIINHSQLKFFDTLAAYLQRIFSSSIADLEMVPDTILFTKFATSFGAA